MADKEEATLPKATISKIIREILKNEGDIRCANETRDLIVECCVEFVQMMSSQANEICEKENKKTISAEHIIKALQQLGFHDYVNEVTEVYDHHKLEIMKQNKKQKAKKNSQLSEEELLKEQQRLIAQSKLKYETQMAAAAAAGGAVPFSPSTTAPMTPTTAPMQSTSAPMFPPQAHAATASPFFASSGTPAATASSVGAGGGGAGSGAPSTMILSGLAGLSSSLAGAAAASSVAPASPFPNAAANIANFFQQQQQAARPNFATVTPAAFLSQQQNVNNNKNSST
eukprot:GEZU01015020.1.p1 GENE.GEZU01015020.1~~GEZU01015020.1.p1  ORF type:complete len:285 (-),score=75.03 GEZU01015020.1:69-923(-)